MSNLLRVIPVVNDRDYFVLFLVYHFSKKQSNLQRFTETSPDHSSNCSHLHLNVFHQKNHVTKVRPHLRIVLTSCQGIVGMELTGKRFR